MKPKKKDRKKHWPDPSAPSKKLGELALVLDDYECFMREAVNNLHTLGVKVEQSCGPESKTSQFRFRSRDVQLARIAEEAYRLGISQSIRGDLEKDFVRVAGLLDGYYESLKKRKANREERAKQFLVAYATEMTQGNGAVASIAKTCGIPRATAYTFLKEFTKAVRVARGDLKKENPTLSADRIEAAIVARYAGEAGVNAATVRAALKTQRRK